MGETLKTRALAHARREDGSVVLSTEAPCDQDGLILSAAGWDLSRGEAVPFKMFFNHSTWSGDPRESAPIGRWEDVIVDGDKLVGRPVFASEEDPERAGVIARLWEGGFLDDVSVSFEVDGSQVAGPVTVDGRKYSVSNRHTLREASVCGIGADQSAGKGRLLEAVYRRVISEDEARTLDGEFEVPDVALTINNLNREAESLRGELALMRGQLADLLAKYEALAESGSERLIRLEDIEPPEPSIDAAQVRQLIRDTITEAMASVRNDMALLAEREAKRQRGQLPD